MDLDPLDLSEAQSPVLLLVKTLGKKKKRKRSLPFTEASPQLGTCNKQGEARRETLTEVAPLEAVLHLETR